MSQPLLPNPFGLRRGQDRLGHAGVKVKWEPVEARHEQTTPTLSK